MYAVTLSMSRQWLLFFFSSIFSFAVTVAAGSRRRANLLARSPVRCGLEQTKTEYDVRLRSIISDSTVDGDNEAPSFSDLEN